jgi:hypothetical protein
MAPLILNLGITWRAVNSLTYMPLYPGKRTGTHYLESRLVPRAYFECTENIHVLHLPVKTAVQSAALPLHKMHRRDALNHPFVTVLFVYHEPHVTIQINVWSVTVATELYIRQIFSEQLGTLRNTNLQRTPGQTVWISAQSSCTLRCRNVWTAPTDPLGGNANPSQISQQLFEAQPDFMWQSVECDLLGITARITFSPYRAAHWWRHHSASCDCPVCRRQLQELNRHPASESFILQGTWSFRGRSRKDTGGSGVSTVPRQRECRAVAVHAIRRVEIQLH